MAAAAAADVRNRYELRMTTEHIEREVPFMTKCPMRAVASDAMACVAALVLTRARAAGHGPPPPADRRLLLRSQSGGHVSGCGLHQQARRCRHRPSSIPNLFICSKFSVAVYPMHPSSSPPLSTAAPAGKKVYIHCKAGRGRSASLACCYLIASGERARAAADRSLCPSCAGRCACTRRMTHGAGKMTAEEARDFLIEKRPQVNAVAAHACRKPYAPCHMCCACV